MGGARTGATAAAALAVSLSCAILPQARAVDGYTPPSSDAFVRSIRSYPHVTAAPRRERIRAGVPQLTRCMPWTRVRTFLGDPDFGYLAYSQGSQGRQPSKELWNYVLEKKAASETEPGSRVVVWFDAGGMLQGVTVHGAPDIEHSISRRGGKCPQP
jgi:hypothetical protein